MIKLISHSNDSGEWSSIYIMEATGKAFVRLYWYHDDKESMYLDSLSVDGDERREGIGKFLLNRCKEISIERNAKTLCLCVEKNSWMQKWYEREDFQYVKKYDKKIIWMKKQL